MKFDFRVVVHWVVLPGMGGGKGEAAERGGLHGFTDLRTENGSSQRHDLALNSSCVPSWLDSGLACPLSALMLAGATRARQRHI